MTKPANRGFFGVVFDTMGWPLFCGMALCTGFYALIHYGVVDSPFVRRYFAGHPVEYIETAMFFVGISAIVGKLFTVMGQFGTMSKVEFTSRPEGGQKLADVPDMIQSLSDMPSYVRKSYLARRLLAALEHVRRRGDATHLDDELKHLSDLDVTRQHEGYALLRIIIWATPMLGFLGTVIGITLALGDLSPSSLVNTPEKAMEGLLAGLSVAFDTTALALSLSVILMFCQFLTNQAETDLLLAVDSRVAAELTGRFEEAGTDSGSDDTSIRQTSESVVSTVEELVQRQSRLWEGMVESAQQQWSRVVDSAVDQVKDGFDGALRQSVQDHTSDLARLEEDAVRRAEQFWSQLQSVLTENARVMQEQQSELVRQGDGLLGAVEKAGEVTRLQESLNQNLDALSGSHDFENTATSLAAAVNLLSSRLSGVGIDKRSVRLFDSDDRGRVA